ncbi:hypothetical protein ASC64_03625 [Nocardioides sp. Root122]|uniref:hypothetical protein n=1 Tax=Nocardioides TaxID=1839 RepID=UPI0007027A58|nr:MULTISPECIES: hypothetical protein [Nocardioides]KQV78080.1 hypothetical protein ASC64_03625 [Nocardioides sp. Root122]MCK9822401.1 hypothetical protein [Nocardioides cavernae]
MEPPDLPREARVLEPEEPYDAVRGTCPRCGSADVLHLVIGMPAARDDVGGGPDWVRWVGCVHPGHDRECRSCGAHWVAARG